MSYKNGIPPQSIRTAEAYRTFTVRQTGCHMAGMLQASAAHFEHDRDAIFDILLEK